MQRLIPAAAALGAVLAVTAFAAGPAQAQRFDGRDRERHERFEHEHFEHERWERERWERAHGYGRPYLRPGYYAPPPVYYAPPRPYYAPPPLYQAPGFGFPVPFR